MSQEGVSETFDRWADLGRDAGMEEEHGDVVRQVVARMELPTGTRVLDLGCGNGWATRLIAANFEGVEAVGVEAAPKMVARANELHDSSIAARYETGSFEALGFRDGEFDRVFSMEALY